jgi:hypothetical protein
MGDKMSFKGTWRMHNEGPMIHQQTGPNSVTWQNVPDEYIEDDGKPFEDGEEVELLVRRVQ